jgi:transcriptional regulator with XRE-family HTH domain
VSAASPQPRDVAVELGARLMQLRKERGLTQEALAHRAGISRNHLQLLEDGLSDRAKQSPANPRLSTLLALCHELGATVTIDVVRPAGVVIEVDPRLGEHGSP